MPVSSKLLRHLIIFATLVCWPNFAFAYIGPAMGTGAFITALVFIIVVVVTCAYLVYLPIKKIIRKKRED